jgi:hypothetical protein
MPHTYTNRSKPAAALLVLVLAALLLAACGGSSKSVSTSATASASTSAPGGGAGARGGRFSALRECLQKQGITLPRRSPGSPGTPGAGGLLGPGSGQGPTLPSGVSRAQFEAATKKCGGGNFARGGRAPNSPARTTALTAFAGCMRANGVNLPAPNTSGKGPVFNTSGLNVTSAQLNAAQAKCSSALQGAFGSGRAGGGAPPAA